ncbi:MAG TPA: hypothetical protein VHG91_09165 [Longimicrobium sp.]|nr:hypothetical protein [Longimicrobium sp.]
MPAVIRAAWVALVLLLAACRQGPPARYAELFALPLDEQPAAMRRFPLADQVEIYLWATVRQAPARLSLAEPIAARGREAVPALLARLRTAEGWEVARLLYVFEVMACRHPEVRADRALLAELEASVPRASTPAARRRAAWSLGVFDGRRGCGAGPVPR